MTRVPALCLFFDTEYDHAVERLIRYHARCSTTKRHFQSIKIQTLLKAADYLL